MPLELLLLAQMHAPNHLSAGALPGTHWGAYIAPPDSLAGLGAGPTGNGKEGGELKRREEGRDGRGGEGVLECANPELASLGSESFPNGTWYGAIAENKFGEF